MTKFIVPILLTLVLTACGGGGGGSSADTKVLDSLNHVANIQNTVNTVYNTAVADLNGDGLDDVVVSGWFYDSPTSSIWVLIQNSDGTLSDRTQAILGTTTTSGSQHVYIADFDNDGKNDIWVPGLRDGSAFVATNSVMFWGTGSNSQFTRQVFTELVIAHGACIDDVNNDGRLDMLVGGGGIYINNGNRNFTLDSSLIPGNNYFAACAVSHQANGDVNILLTNNYTVAGFSDNINVYDSNMNFQTSFGVAKQAGEGDTINAIAIDVNGDGAKDFIVMRNGGFGRDVYLNNGNNSYVFDSALDTTMYNEYYTQQLSINGVQTLLFPGGSAGTRIYQVNNGLTPFKLNSFSDMASGYASGQAQAVYRNATTNKFYMLQLLVTNFYTKELQ